MKYELLYWLTKKVCSKFNDMDSEISIHTDFRGRSFSSKNSTKNFLKVASMPKTRNKKIEGGNKRRPLMAWRY